MRDLGAITEAIVELDEERSRRLVAEALATGAAPAAVLDAAREAMGELGRRFETGEAFLPELVMAGELMSAVADTVTPLLGAQQGPVGGQIVLGTVHGDVHDIGKNIVATLLGAAGYEVVDLGVDVSPECFVEAVAGARASIVGLSCLLTVGFESMKRTVAALREAAPASGVRVMIGGGAVSETLCEHVGADGWGADAPAAVTLARRWTSAAHEIPADAADTASAAQAEDAKAPPSAPASDGGSGAGRATARGALAAAGPSGSGGLSPASVLGGAAEGGDHAPTADERFASRFDTWERAEHLDFASPEAAERYRRHCGWIRAAIELQGTVVPVCGSFLHYPYRELGVGVRAAMYDYDVLARALLDFHAEHLPDAVSVDPLLPGPVFDLLECRQWVWPGHGVDDEGAFQWVEGEYMRADEYELLLDDPTRFWLTRYLPRVFPVLAPLAELPPLTDIDSAGVTMVLEHAGE